MQRDRPALDLGDKAREVIASEPPLDLWGTTCLRAWKHLGSARYLGFAGAGPIPWPHIERWCEVRSFDLDETELVVDVISILDSQRAERMATPCP